MLRRKFLQKERTNQPRYEAPKNGSQFVQRYQFLYFPAKEKQILDLVSQKLEGTEKAQPAVRDARRAQQHRSPEALRGRKQISPAAEQRAYNDEQIQTERLSFEANGHADAVTRSKLGHYR